MNAFRFTPLPLITCALFGLLLSYGFFQLAPVAQGTTIPPFVNLVVEKTDQLHTDADQDGEASPGDTLKYELTVTNTGNTPATNVLIEDKPDTNTTLIASSVQSSQGLITTGEDSFDVQLNNPLGVQETVTIRFRVLINHPFPANVVRVNNQAIVRGSNFATTVSDDPATLAVDDPTRTRVIAGPRLHATKVDSLLIDADNDSAPSPGDTLQYTIVITNSGNQAAVNLRLNDLFDGNTTLVTGSLNSSQGTVNATASGFTANLGALGADEVATVAYAVQIKNPLAAGVTSVSNQGLITSNNAPDLVTDDPHTPNANDATVTLVVAAPLLAVTKSDTLVVDRDQDGAPSPGDELEYQITVRNSGNQQADGIVIDDTPDPNTTLVVGSVTAGAGATVLAGNSAGDTRVQVALTEPLNVGSALVVSFRVTINTPLVNGVSEISNQAVVDGTNVTATLSDDPETQAVGDPTITLIARTPRIDLFKNDSLLVDADNNGIPSPGDTLAYQLTLINSGNQEAAEIVLTDQVDPNTTLVVGSVQSGQGEILQGNNPGDTRVQVALGVAPADATTTLSFQVRIVNPLPSGVNSVANQATASGANFAPVQSDDPTTAAVDDATVTTVTATPVLVVSKRDYLFTDADGDDEVGPGDMLLYSIQIINNGNVAATNVLLTDTPDPRTTLHAGKVQVSQGMVVTGNSSGDQMVEVNLGTIPPKATVNVGLRVVIGGTAALAVTNQATVEYLNPNDATGVTLIARSDDPDSAAIEDATVTPLKGALTQSGTLHLPLLFR
jgi:large repetitive protein